MEINFSLRTRLIRVLLRFVSLNRLISIKKKKKKDHPEDSNLNCYHDTLHRIITIQRIYNALAYVYQIYVQKCISCDQIYFQDLLDELNIYNLFMIRNLVLKRIKLLLLIFHHCIIVIFTILTRYTIFISY